MRWFEEKGRTEEPANVVASAVDAFVPIKLDPSKIAKDKNTVIKGVLVSAVHHV